MKNTHQDHKLQVNRQEIIRIFTSGKPRLMSELPRKSWAGAEVRNARRY